MRYYRKVAYLLACLLIGTGLIGCGSSTYQVHTGVSDLSFYPPGQQSNSIFVAPKDGASVIKKGDAIEITLQRVFIRDFRESGKKGEIAVVGKVYEDNIIRDQTLESIKDGRLIYYGEGVAKTGQILNGIGLPMYGPILYEGNDIVMEFYVIERDQKESEQLANIFKVVAQLGGKAYPPGSPYLDLLGQIGSAILASNKDDLEVEYKAFLQPNDGHAGLPKLLLQAGNYVLVRKLDDRRNPIQWNTLILDAKTGEISKKITTQDSVGNTYDYFVPFTDMSYIVIQINTADIMRAKATAEAQTLAQFVFKEEESINDNIKNLSDKLNNIDVKFEAIKKANLIKVADKNKSEGKVVLYDALEIVVGDLQSEKDKRRYSNDQIDLMLNELRLKYPGQLSILTKKNLSDSSTTLSSVRSALGL